MEKMKFVEKEETFKEFKEDGLPESSLAPARTCILLRMVAPSLVMMPSSEEVEIIFSVPLRVTRVHW